MAGVGLRIARSQGAEGMTGNLREFPIDPSYTTKIHNGKLVTLNGGNIEAGAAAAGSKYLGIMRGVRFTEADGSVKFQSWWDGGANRTDIMAHIAVLPAGATAMIKGDPGETYTAADIGTRKTISAVAGDDRTGLSGDVLGAAGQDAATAALIVLQELDIPDGDRWFEVMLASDSSVLQSGT